MKTLKQVEAIDAICEEQFKDQEITEEVLENHLIENEKIPQEQIAVSTEDKKSIRSSKAA